MKKLSDMVRKVETVGNKVTVEFELDFDPTGMDVNDIIWELVQGGPIVQDEEE